MFVYIDLVMWFTHVTQNLLFMHEISFYSQTNYWCHWPIMTPATPEETSQSSQRNKYIHDRKRNELKTY